MGYSLNGDAANGETLYVSGVGLASLDTKTFDLKFLGSLTYGRTELTGLDKQLFAFSVESGVIAGLNKTTGATEVDVSNQRGQRQSGLRLRAVGRGLLGVHGERPLDRHAVLTDGRQVRRSSCRTRGC